MTDIATTPLTKNHKHWKNWFNASTAFPSEDAVPELSDIDLLVLWRSSSNGIRQRMKMLDRFPLREWENYLWMYYPILQHNQNGYHHMEKQMEPMVKLSDVGMIQHMITNMTTDMYDHHRKHRATLNSILPVLLLNLHLETWEDKYRKNYPQQICERLHGSELLNNSLVQMALLFSQPFDSTWRWMLANEIEKHTPLCLDAKIYILNQQAYQSDLEREKRTEWLMQVYETHPELVRESYKDEYLDIQLTQLPTHIAIDVLTHAKPMPGHLIALGNVDIVEHFLLNADDPKPGFFQKYLFTQFNEKPEDFVALLEKKPHWSTLREQYLLLRDIKNSDNDAIVQASKIILSKSVQALELPNPAL